MTLFWIGFAGAWVGAVSVGLTLYILYRIELSLRAKKARELDKELKDIMDLLRSSDLGNSSAKDTKFN